MEGLFDPGSAKSNERSWEAITGGFHAESRQYGKSHERLLQLHTDRAAIILQLQNSNVFLTNSVVPIPPHYPISTFMEDDFTFGASVWGSAAPTSLLPPPTFASPPTLSREPSTTDSFDDFDDFGTPAESMTPSAVEADDDFGDFGEFGDAEELGGETAFDEGGFGSLHQQPIAGPSSYAPIRPLQVDPLPSDEELRKELDERLGSLWGEHDKSLYTDQPIRQVGGRNQMLITPERYLPSLRSTSYPRLESQINPVVNCMMSSSLRRNQYTNPLIGHDQESADNT